MVRGSDGLASPRRLLTQWPGAELGKAGFLSSLSGAWEAGGPASKLAGMATLVAGIFPGDAEGTADSELSTPTFGFRGGERVVWLWGAPANRGRGSRASPLRPIWELRRGGKHELGVLEIVVHNLQGACRIHPPDG